MFEYFPNNYTWSLAVMSALNRGGRYHGKAAFRIQEEMHIHKLVRE